MPHGQDLEEDADAESTYECMRCGTIVKGHSNPGACECGGEFQNRAKSLE